MNWTRIHPNVLLGEGTQVEDFVVLGYPPKGREPGELPLEIGMSSRIRSHSTLYAGSRIGVGFQTGHGVLIREECSIGDDCSVGSGSVLEFKVRMGNRVRLHSRVFVPEYSVLEDDAWLGPHVVLTNSKYPSSARAKSQLRGVRVGIRARIGANATILPGVIVGAGALVGAGSVVTKDVPPRTVVVGNPARAVRSIDDLIQPEDGAPVYERERT